MHTGGLETATARDLEPLLRLREQLAVWLATKGIDQWQAPMPRDRLRAWIDAGEVFVDRAGTDIAAAVALLRTDPGIWGTEDSVPARYVHLLMVDRTFAGRGLGARVLRRAEIVAASAGAQVARLDAAADNAALQAWYAERGYGVVDTRVIHDGPHRFEVTRREKALARASSYDGP